LKQRDIKKYKKKAGMEASSSDEENKEDEKAKVSSDDENKYDNEEEGGEWVTVENLYSHISGGATLLMGNEDNLLFTEGAEPVKQEETQDQVNEVTEQVQSLSPFATPS
jgi:hypothetical protein